ncbi:GNAT family N-acetyltransferase [Streptomyces sp. NPDC050560]|uniref:GNAT family N-acetyltransferase n=1 Tax=Streptomyces sp. NPDC050560 TaxID=3365630 RepID=UPI0037AC06C2
MIRGHHAATAADPKGLHRSGSIAGLAPLWSAATRGAPTLCATPRWLECNEPPNAGGLHYAVTADTRGALAVRRIDAGGFPANDPLAPFTADTPLEPADRQRAKALAAALRPYLPALTPTAAALLPGAYAPGVLAPEEPPVIAALLDELEATAERWRCPTSAVMHVPDTAHALRTALAARGYAGATTLAQTVLPLPGGTFDDYLAGLTSKRRRNVRREARAFAASGMTVRRAGIDEFTSEHAELHVRQLRRYGHDATAAQMVDIVRRSARFFGDWAVFLVAERAGRPEGFSLSYAHSGELHPKMSGFSPYADRHFAYFALVYYEPVAAAQELGLRRLVLGPGTYDAKSHRGCRIEPRTSYVRVTHRAAAPLVADLAALADRGGRAALRRAAAPDTP